MTCAPRRYWLALLGLATGVVAFTSPEPRADEPAPAAGKLEPVESDMHEFMEYAFQEPYKRMKASLAKPPADNAAWKIVKSDALILAEGCNLLLDRGPEENRAAWRKHATDVRTAGAELYQAGKAKDYEAVKAKWSTLLQRCNACHDDFSEGDPQLAP